MWRLLYKAGMTRINTCATDSNCNNAWSDSLAFGLNIDFIRMFTELNPHIHFGGQRYVLGTFVMDYHFRSELLYIPHTCVCTGNILFILQRQK